MTEIFIDANLYYVLGFSTPVLKAQCPICGAINLEEAGTCQRCEDNYARISRDLPCK